ncbi:MAG TPA: DUF2934 domain-containing protein [Vicinamibacterales bacterium]|nr:DUF2934 domain-containing protein [Vicinamibacterales bacterium]
MAAIILLEIGEAPMAKRPSAKSKSTDATTPKTPAPAKPKAPRARATSAPAAAPEPSADDIRRRAYERYLERGGKHGEHFDDWVAAEAELRSKK